MKILVIQQKMIGDVLTSSILFEALREKYPSAELHYLIYSHTRPVVENNPYINRIIEYDPVLNKNPFKFLKLLRLVNDQAYDVVLDVYSKISTGIISRVSGASKRLGFQKTYTRPAYTRTFKYKSIPQTSAGLAIENRMLLLQGLDTDFAAEKKPKIYLSKEDLKNVRYNLAQSGINFSQPLIMCGVLGSSAVKTYPHKYIVSVLNDLVEQGKELQILFNYLPSQKKEAYNIYRNCSYLTQSRIFFDIYESDLKGFILNCANCDLFIGNEGGAANIAKALKLPAFSIYSPAIKKIDWAIYEDDVLNKSIHIEDVRPDLTGDHNRNNNSLQSDELYKKFTPNHISSELHKFMTENGF